MGLLLVFSPDIDMILLIPSGSQTWQWRIQHFRDAVSHEKNGFFKPKCYIPEAYIVKNGHDLGGTPAVGDGIQASLIFFLKMGVWMAMGEPQNSCLTRENPTISHHFMDKNWGYPCFRKPPYDQRLE